MLESCPIVLYPSNQENLVNQLVFGDYVFRWNNEFDCLVLGYGSLYNHSFNANADYQRDYKNKLMKFITLKDIELNEEITINYDKSINDPSQLDKSYLTPKFYEK